MAVPKVLLFYQFTPLADPDAIRLWQRDLCRSLGLGGRIILSPHGINATVGGELRAVKTYLRTTREYPAFKNLDVKWSEGGGDDFPRLSVRVRNELVSFGAPGELRVDENGVIGGGTKLNPEQLHQLVQTDEVVFFDGRNSFEAEIGHFAGAVVPQVSNTREFVAELDSGKYDHLKDKPVVTYCTGGIRCEVLSSLMINRGFNNVYQLDGGIAKYGETYGDSGLWRGSLYVFDNRLSMNFSADTEAVGRCYRCQTPTQNMQNCSDLGCRSQLVVCTDHSGETACELHPILAQVESAAGQPRT